MLKMLTNYAYCSDKHHISIPQSSFEKLAIQASVYVNLYTSNRISELTDEIQDTTYEIIELLNEQHNLKAKLLDNSKEVASETVDKHSISYVNKTNIISNQILSDNDLERKIYSICYKHLAYTGLMNRGAYKCFRTK